MRLNYRRVRRLPVTLLVGRGLLVSVDESVLSEAILPEAALWVRAFGYELWLAQVIGSGAPPEPDVLEGNYLRGVVAELTDQGVKAEWDVLHGHHAARAILYYATHQTCLTNSPTAAGATEAQQRGHRDTFQRP